MSGLVSGHGAYPRFNTLKMRPPAVLTWDLDRQRRARPNRCVVSRSRNRHASVLTQPSRVEVRILAYPGSGSFVALVDPSDVTSVRESRS